MKASLFGVAMALACLAPHPARSQSAVYSDAISRPILLVNGGAVADDTDAVSRQVLIVNAGLAADWADAVSRQVILVNAGNGYGLEDVHQALRLAGGMLHDPPGGLGRFDPVKDGESGGRVDVQDAAHIVRIVFGLDSG